MHTAYELTQTMIPHLLRPILRFCIALCVLHNATAAAQSVINRSLAPADRQGVLEPYKDTDVATAEIGVIRELFVKPGDVVQERDEIGRLDYEQQRVMVEEAEIDANAFGMLEAARREMEFNKRRVDEATKWVAAGTASPKELERYKLDLGISKAKLQAQEESKLISNAKLAKARLMLSDRTIRAPHRGTVVAIHRDVGEYIAGNVPSIIRLVDTSKLRARFYLSDEAAERFRKAGFAEIRLANHVVVKAAVEFIAPFAIADGHVIEMTIVIDNEDGLIRSTSCELVQS
jgi:RND family efflux transporter MFP subunit